MLLRTLEEQWGRTLLCPRTCCPGSKSKELTTWPHTDVFQQSVCCQAQAHSSCWLLRELLEM